MAFKAQGTIASIPMAPGSLEPVHPITASDAAGQWEAILTALGDMAGVLGVDTLPWTVSVDGNGLSYPTSAVLISVAYAVPASQEGGATWEANSADITSRGDLTKRLSAVGAAGGAPGPGVAEQEGAAWAAVGALVDSGTIGNRSIPYHARVTGDTNAPTAVLTIRVDRAVAGEEYGPAQAVASAPG